MAIKDSVFTWFIQNVISPNMEIIDKPGFVVTSFTEKGKETYLRDIFTEDKLFEFIENKVVDKFGEKGVQALYSSGKKFGYTYSSLSNFPQLKQDNQKEVTDFIYFLVRYITTIYAKEATYTADLNTKTFTITLEDYIVCHNNGKGYLMTWGGISGIWAYIMNDKTIEGIQIQCQGKGAPKCVLVAKPIGQFNSGEKVITETNINSSTFDIDYKKKNLVRTTQFAKNSLKTLLDSHFFLNKSGSLTYKGIRYFHCESNMMYIMEQEMSKLADGSKVLFDASFEFGEYLQKQYGGKDYQKFIGDYFPALGWGDVFVSTREKIEVVSAFFPWTQYSAQSQYLIFAGVTSGFISSCIGRRIELKTKPTQITEQFTVRLYES